MKYFRIVQLLAVALILGTGVTACKRKQPPVTHLGPGIRGPGDPRDLGGGGQLNPGDTVQPTPIGGGEAATFNPDDFNQDRGALAAQTVYFAFDSSSIRPDEQSKIQAVANALRSDMSAKLLIEGDCDERGTEEYNRSLGERRALAAREALATLGIDAGRVATRSYGEDRPALQGHDESAWSRNRRDEFVLLHPK